MRGKVVWKQLAPKLMESKLLSGIDRNTLTRYCDMYGRWRDCADWIDKHGEVYQMKDENGVVKYLQQWPQVGIYNKLSAQLFKMEQDFGMTPSARTRITIEKKPAANTEKGKFFAKHG